jgi:membrane peptidoglycan carboxypeptidase
VLSKEAAANIDWALSFDNNMAGATAEGNVSFRRGDLIAKTGTLGQGSNASQAWFIGATPEQYAMSVALFTNNPGTEVLNNLPSAPDGTPGSQGGGWPATIWNNFMTTEFSNTAAVPLFTPTNGAPFVPWIQAHPQKKKPAQCKGGQNNQTKRCNPNGGPTTGPGGRPCHGHKCQTWPPTSPPTTWPPTSPPTSPTPSPGPSCTPTPTNPCNTPPGPGAGGLSGGAANPSAALTAFIVTTEPESSLLGKLSRLAAVF